MTPHGKNESIARAGIERKHEWHDTARQKREHRTRWHHKQDKSGSIICAHTNQKSHGRAVGTGARWRVPPKSSPPQSAPLSGKKLELALNRRNKNYESRPH